MKNKVFIIIDNLGTGGTQRQIIEYLKFANRDKFLIKVINLDKNYNTLEEEITKIGYEVIGIEHRGFLNLSTVFQLKRLFKEERPDIVHTFLFTSDFYGRLTAKLANVPVIISSVRNVDIWKKWHHILADKILARWTDNITINAENIRPYLVEKVKINPDKIVKIYNGIDVNKFLHRPSSIVHRDSLGIKDDNFVVGMVSRFSEQKDYDTFFKAAEIVLKQIPNTYFVAVGEGPLLKGHQVTTSQSHQLKEKVIFTGLRKDVPDLINAMDVCVLASHYEGCPNVILEYMACSKPVIASDVGGCSELVVDNKTGFIVPSKNPQEIAEKIIRLLNDRKLIIEFGKEGRKRIEEHFTSGVMAKNTEDLYEESLKPKIAYILSQFPEMHETFILREIDALRRKGIEIEIFSLKYCRDKIIHPQAIPLIKGTHYPKLIFSLIFSNLYFVSIGPIRYFKTLFYIIFKNISSFNYLWKSLYIFPISVHYAKIIKNKRIKHIHAHWLTIPTTSAIIISGLLNIKFSITAHAWDIFLPSPMKREKIKMAEFVITCTQFNKKYLEERINEDLDGKVVVNYHGINLGNYPRSNDSKNRNIKIISIGALQRRKGFDYLIKACAILKEKNIDFGCKIVGGGIQRKKLTRLIHNYGLQDKVELLGERKHKDVMDLLSNSDLFVLPCIITDNGNRDGIPNVILEAFASSLPVISTDISGIPEVVRVNETGILVPEKNEFALAEAIEFLLKNKEKRVFLGSQGRKLVEEKFDIEKNVAELARIFKEKVFN